MTDAVQIAWITGASIVVASSVPAWFSYQASRTAKSTQFALNSRLDLFMDMAKKTFRAEGAKQEQVDEQKRQTAKKKEKK